MSPETFEYWGVELPYLTHLYNITYLTERRVEVPIATHWIAQQASAHSGVEVGNVLGHYSLREHFVIDRDEPRAWYQEQQEYLNEDLFELDTYDLHMPWVVSLSTVEHTDDPIAAIELLQQIAPRGLVSFPTGVSPALDAWVLDGAVTRYAERACTLVRTGDGTWAQTPFPEVRPYGPWANSVVIMEWERP